MQGNIAFESTEYCISDIPFHNFSKCLKQIDFCIEETFLL